MKKIGIANIKDLEDGIVPKAWGEEVVIHNDSDYCGKILRFNEGAKFSMHFHMEKSETWFVHSGEFRLRYIDPEDASEHFTILIAGDVVEIPRGQPHQLFALTIGEIFEVSTPHRDDDSYRIRKGDSQS
jgi:mannose-6-phosphate isomerase-like protein (cupin superfamily)